MRVELHQGRHPSPGRLVLIVRQSRHSWYCARVSEETLYKKGVIHWLDLLCGAY